MTMGLVLAPGAEHAEEDSLLTTESSSHASRRDPKASTVLLPERRPVLGRKWLAAGVCAAFGLLLFSFRGNARVSSASLWASQLWVSTRPWLKVDDVMSHYKKPENVTSGWKMAGVNLGGWYCLEDWFFSGSNGRNVMSLDTEGQGACLPPHLNSLDKPWPSEGILTFRLNASRGSQHAASVLDGHRQTFIGEDDLQGIADIGMTTIRVPITWAAFADALAPLDRKIFGSHNPETDTVIVPDPFYYDKAAFATIPRQQLSGLMRKAAAKGLKVVLDLHAFPGGAQDATYNGVWPLQPVFWTESARIGTGELHNAPLTLLGTLLAQKMVTWLEDLDLEAKEGLAGITLMNEPAHMNAWRGFARDDDILSWLGNCANVFRTSQLPSLGKKLLVNLIFTGFKDFDNTAVPWFKETFTHEERSEWAVADVHYYTAWDHGSCDGRTVAGGGYMCDAPFEDLRQLLHSCTAHAIGKSQYQFGGGLMTISEFSVGTFQDARFACKDKRFLLRFLQEQLAVFDSMGVQPFFWTWRMPYGPIFEPGWSLKWLSGLEDSQAGAACHTSTPSLIAA